jgi:PAS domain S-box-containing protein
MSSAHAQTPKTCEPAEKNPCPIRCWELLACTSSFCPAHSNRGEPCWRVPHTHCAALQGLKSVRKVQTCLLCPVFRLSGERDERGWNFFLSDELVYLNRDETDSGAQHEVSFQEIVKHLPYGLVVTDSERTIRFFNSAAEHITGTLASAAVGSTIENLFGKECAEPATPFGVSAEGTKDFVLCEREATMPDGRTVLISRQILAGSGQSSESRGEAYLLEDLTAKQRLQDQLKYFEIQYRRIFEDSKDLIFAHSKGSIFQEVNQACVETLGYQSREELLALRSVERIYVNPVHRKVFQQQIDRNGFVKDFETSFWKKDGSRIHCLISGTAVRDREGKIIGYEAIAKDITARMDGVRHLLQQHRELTLLHSVAAVMNVTHELEEILTTALKKVLELMNFTSGCVFLVDQEKSAFVLTVQQGFLKDLVEKKHRITFHDGALMRSLLMKDLSIKHQRAFPPFKVNLKFGQDSVELTCFLITTKEKASGFVALCVPPNRSMSDHDYQMLGSLGNFLGSAIENAILLQTVHRHREELRRLTARLLYSQEEERKRIAQELHDEVGSSLTGINFALETVEKSLSPTSAEVRESFLEVKKQINRTYQEMRRISHRLRPAVLSELGLEPALDACLARISKYSHIAIDFKMVGFEGRLDPEIETVLYRISQEAINNTLKHSEAKQFKLSIVKSFPNIILLAEDDGMGFDPRRLAEHNQRALGLVVMRERAAILGGKFSMRSSRRKGTRIRVEIPIKESSFD